MSDVDLTDFEREIIGGIRAAESVVAHWSMQDHVAEVTPTRIEIRLHPDVMRDAAALVPNLMTACTFEAVPVVFPEKPTVVSRWSVAVFSTIHRSSPVTEVHAVTSETMLPIVEVAVDGWGAGVGKHVRL